MKLMIKNLNNNIKLKAKPFAEGIIAKYAFSMNAYFIDVDLVYKTKPLNDKRKKRIKNIEIFNTFINMKLVKNKIIYKGVINRIINIDSIFSSTYYSNKINLVTNKNNNLNNFNSYNNSNNYNNYYNLNSYSSKKIISNSKKFGSIYKESMLEKYLVKLDGDKVFVNKLDKKNEMKRNFNILSINRSKLERRINATKAINCRKFSGKNLNVNTALVKGYPKNKLKFSSMNSHDLSELQTTIIWYYFLGSPKLVRFSEIDNYNRYSFNDYKKYINNEGDITWQRYLNKKLNRKKYFNTSMIENRNTLKKKFDNIECEKFNYKNYNKLYSRKFNWNKTINLKKNTKGNYIKKIAKNILINIVDKENLKNSTEYFSSFFSSKVPLNHGNSYSRIKVYFLNITKKSVSNVSIIYINEIDIKKNTRNLKRLARNLWINKNFINKNLITNKIFNLKEINNIRLEDLKFYKVFNSILGTRNIENVYQNKSRNKIKNIETLALRMIKSININKEKINYESFELSNISNYNNLFKTDTNGNFKNEYKVINSKSIYLASMVNKYFCENIYIKEIFKKERKELRRVLDFSKTNIESKFTTKIKSKYIKINKFSNEIKNKERTYSFRVSNLEKNTEFNELKNIKNVNIKKDKILVNVTINENKIGIDYEIYTKIKGKYVKYNVNQLVKVFKSEYTNNRLRNIKKLKLIEINKLISAKYENIYLKEENKVKELYSNNNYVFDKTVAKINNSYMERIVFHKEILKNERKERRFIINYEDNHFLLKNKEKVVGKFSVNLNENKIEINTLFSMRKKCYKANEFSKNKDFTIEIKRKYIKIKNKEGYNKFLFKNYENKVGIDYGIYTRIKSKCIEKNTNELVKVFNNEYTNNKLRNFKKVNLIEINKLNDTKYENIYLKEENKVREYYSNNNYVFEKAASKINNSYMKKISFQKEVLRFVIKYRYNSFLLNFSADLNKNRTDINKLFPISKECYKVSEFSPKKDFINKIKIKYIKIKNKERKYSFRESNLEKKIKFNELKNIKNVNIKREKILDSVIINESKIGIDYGIYPKFKSKYVKCNISQLVKVFKKEYTNNRLRNIKKLSLIEINKFNDLKYENIYLKEENNVSELYSNNNYVFDKTVSKINNSYMKSIVFHKEILKNENKIDINTLFSISKNKDFTIEIKRKYIKIKNKEGYNKFLFKNYENKVDIDYGIYTILKSKYMKKNTNEFVKVFNNEYTNNKLRILKKMNLIEINKLNDTKYESIYLKEENKVRELYSNNNYVFDKTALKINNSYMKRIAFHKDVLEKKIKEIRFVIKYRYNSFLLNFLANLNENRKDINKLFSISKKYYKVSEFSQKKDFTTKIKRKYIIKNINKFINETKSEFINETKSKFINEIKNEYINKDCLKNNIKFFSSKICLNCGNSYARIRVDFLDIPKYIKIKNKEIKYSFRASNLESKIKFNELKNIKNVNIKREKILDNVIINESKISIDYGIYPKIKSKYVKCNINQLVKVFKNESTNNRLRNIKKLNLIEINKFNDVKEDNIYLKEDNIYLKEENKIREFYSNNNYVFDKVALKMNNSYIKRIAFHKEVLKKKIKKIRFVIKYRYNSFLQKNQNKIIRNFLVDLNKNRTDINKLFPISKKCYKVSEFSQEKHFTTNSEKSYPMKFLIMPNYYMNIRMKMLNLKKLNIVKEEFNNIILKNNLMKDNLYYQNIILSNIKNKLGKRSSEYIKDYRKINEIIIERYNKNNNNRSKSNDRFKNNDDTIWNEKNKLKDVENKRYINNLLDKVDLKYKQKMRISKENSYEDVIKKIKKIEHIINDRMVEKSNKLNLDNITDRLYSKLEKKIKLERCRNGF